MAKRHDDALLIQQGAVNPSGIAHSIIAACQEVRDESGNVREDAAIRLMVHQLAHICRVREIDDELSTYSMLTDECAKYANESTLQVCK